MTEISRPWGGTTTGDKGSYSDDNWTDTWSGLFARTGANVGVLRGAANELAVTSSGDNAISVNTGEALSDGTWYQSDATTAVTPGVPSANPRIDRIVLRKSWSAQTVRVTRIEGTEAGSPSAPSLTQTDGTTWDTPLAQYQIATGAGAISSLTDQREFVHDPTGAVDVADGGTGATSLTDGGILLGSGTAAITAMAVLGDGVIVVGDNSTDPTTITALTSSTGTLKHEVGGMEFDASAVTTGDIVAGASAGTMAIVAASGKSDGDVLTLQADGTVAYESIPASGLFISYAIIADQKAANTHSGTFTSGAWQTRDLNDEIADPDTIVSISTNQFTLAAGSYLIRWSAPAYQVGAHQTKLYDETGTADIEFGTAEVATASDTASRSFGSARVTPSGSNAYTIQHYCDTTVASSGFGERNNFGNVLYFTLVEIYKEN